jgi:DNA transformation protein
MAADTFVAYCLELLGSLGIARAKRMFGAHGLYVDDLFVAIVDDEQLFLKVDAETQPCFEAAGCRPFVYGRKDEPITMSYWTAPEEATESPALMLPWARLAQAAALRARAAKVQGAKRKTPAQGMTIRPRRPAP